MYSRLKTVVSERSLKKTHTVADSEESLMNILFVPGFSWQGYIIAVLVSPEWTSISLIRGTFSILKRG